MGIVFSLVAVVQKIIGMILAGRHATEYYRDHTYLGTWSAPNLGEYVAVLAKDGYDRSGAEHSPVGLTSSWNMDTGVLGLTRHSSFSFSEDADRLESLGLGSESLELGLNLSAFKPNLEDLKVNFDQFFEICTQKKLSDVGKVEPTAERMPAATPEDNVPIVEYDDNYDGLPHAKSQVFMVASE